MVTWDADRSERHLLNKLDALKLVGTKSSAALVVLQKAAQREI